MTPRERCLLFRLAAAEEAQEPQSVAVLRRALKDLGWSSERIDMLVRQLRGVFA